MVLLSACAPAIVTSQRPVQPILASSHFRASDSTILPVRSWLPSQGVPKAIVLAVHGFNDYSHAFHIPALRLCTLGVAVFAYDQRGFGNAPRRGQWAGMDAYTADVQEMSRQLKHRYPGLPLFLLGESMGGAVVIAAMTASSPNTAVDGVILSAPAVWSRDMMPWYQRALLGLASLTFPEMQLTGSGLQIRASDNIPMLRGMGQDPLVIKETRVDAIEGLTDLMDVAQARAEALRVPTLVLYGEQDQVIPDRPVAAMLEKMSRQPEIRAAFYPQGYHLLLRDLHRDQPLEDVAAWVMDRQGRLPSGHERDLSDRGWMNEEGGLRSSRRADSDALSHAQRMPRR